MGGCNKVLRGQIKEAMQAHPEWLTLPRREAARRMIQYGFCESTEDAVRKQIKRLMDRGEFEPPEPPPKPQDNDDDVVRGVSELQQDYFHNELDDKYVILAGMASGSVIDGQVIREIQAKYSNMGDGATINEIAREYGWTPDFFNSVRRALRMTHSSLPITHEQVAATINDPEAFEREQRNMIMMQENKLHRAVQRKQWKQTEQDARQWRQFREGVLIPTHDWVLKNAPAKHPYRLRLTQEDHSILFNISDLHIGALGIYGEGLEDTQVRLLGSIERLVRRAACFGRPKKCYVVWNGDTLHMDTPAGTTTKGTPLDMAANPEDVLTFAMGLIRETVERLRMLADVEVWFISGNHDNMTARAMAHGLAFGYEHCDDVTFHLPDPNPWYIVEMGGAMCYLEHGDGPKRKDIPTLMAVQQPEMWARCKHRFAFTGHLHHEKSWDHGVMHYQLRSLAPTDRYHNKGGYVLAERGQDAFLFSATGELFAQLRATV